MCDSRICIKYQEAIIVREIKLRTVHNVDGTSWEKIHGLGASFSENGIIFPHGITAEAKEVGNNFKTPINDFKTSSIRLPTLRARDNCGCS
jgi:hypothetical protein